MAFSVYVTLVVLQISHVCQAFHLGHRRSRGQDEINNRPIIGVLMQSSEGMEFESYGANYISASYVKYLESSGARVVPIRNDLTDEETAKIFQSVNGVLFPGGDVDLVTSGYAKVGGKILRLAKESFDKGDYFPVWGTCQGHEFFSVFVAGTKVLTRTNSENITLTLDFVEGYKKSEMFADLPSELADFLSTVPSTANFHDWSVTLATFNENQLLNDFYNVLSTSVDRNGTEFVSTMEGKTYPFFSVQWHPEENSFEWSVQSNLSHVAKAVESTQYMSNFFVNKARSNLHKFESESAEEAALIYNYTPLYTGNISGFEQCYFFGSSSGRSQSKVNSVRRHRMRYKFNLDKLV